MAIRHNKKRNSGMLGEFFSMFIAEAVVSRNFNRASVAKKLWAKHVKPGTELQKEMSYFKALQGNFTSKQLAYDTLAKVKKASQKLDRAKLEREKTSLIREVKTAFPNSSFFGKEISNYTELASIQVLVDYCSSSKSLSESVINPAMAEIEDRILSSMNKKQEPVATKSLNEIMSMTEDDVDGLVVNIMCEKMNKKFDPKLLSEQKMILKQFVFGNDKKKLEETLTKLRDETVGLIKEELGKKIPKADRDRLTEISGLLTKDYQDVSRIDDDVVTFYMTVSKLNSELKDID